MDNLEKAFFNGKPVKLTLTHIDGSKTICERVLIESYGSDEEGCLSEISVISDWKEELIKRSMKDTITSDQFQNRLWDNIRKAAGGE